LSRSRPLRSDLPGVRSTVGVSRGTSSMPCGSAFAHLSCRAHQFSFPHVHVGADPRALPAGGHGPLKTAWDKLFGRTLFIKSPRSSTPPAKDRWPQSSTPPHFVCEPEREWHQQRRLCVIIKLCASASGCCWYGKVCRRDERKPCFLVQNFLLPPKMCCPLWHLCLPT